MEKNWWVLVIILAMLLISVLCMYIGTTGDVPGLLLNLATESLGILITVFVIQRIIERRENKRGEAPRLKVYLSIISYLDALSYLSIIKAH